MKTILFPCLLILFTLGCSEQSTGLNNTAIMPKFYTDDNSYSISDSVTVFLEPTSNTDIRVALKCGVFLVMSYQRKQNDNWSDDQWFWYMNYRCPTIMDTLSSGNKLEQGLPGIAFDSTGIYRLLVDIVFLETDSTQEIISNTFQIE